MRTAFGGWRVLDFTAERGDKESGYIHLMWRTGNLNFFVLMNLALNLNPRDIKNVRKIGRPHPFFLHFFRDWLLCVLEVDRPRLFRLSLRVQ